MKTESSIIRIDDVASGQWTKLQGIPSMGARDMRHVAISGTSYIVVLNYAGPPQIYKWVGAAKVTEVFIEDPGANYVTGKIRLKCTSAGTCSGGSNTFYHTFAVDALGAITSTTQGSQGGAYLPDHEVLITYPDGTSPMDRSITTAALRASAAFVCGRTYTRVLLIEDSTRGCVLGDVIAPVASNAWRITITGYNASLEKVTDSSFTAGRASTDPAAWGVASSRAECTCTLGAWAACIDVASFATDSLFPQLRFVTAAASIGSGFEVGVEWNAGATAPASLAPIADSKHGAGYTADPTMLLQSQASAGAAWLALDETLGGCRCAAGTTAVPTGCVAFTRTVGSYYCYGGDQHGVACTGSSDTTSCVGLRTTSNGIKYEGGRCTRSPKARISLAPLGDRLQKSRPAKYAIDDPVWIDTPLKSTLVPLDLNNPVQIPVLGGASGMDTFLDAAGATYLIVSVFVNPTTFSHETNSVLFRLAGSSTGVKVTEVQRIPTNGAHGATVMSMPFCSSVCITELNGAFLCQQECSAADTFVFIPFHDGPTSLLLRWDEQAKVLVEVLDVPTAKPVSVTGFSYVGPASTTHYALVAQAGAASTMLRWNGTQFLAAVSPETFSKDTAGGQVLATNTAQKMMVVENGARKPLLLVSQFREAATFLSRPATLLRAQTENILGIATPTRIVIHPNGGYLYVAGYESQSIGVFSLVAGLLFASDLLTVQNAPDYTFEGLTDIAVRGDLLYAASSMTRRGQVKPET